MSTAELHRLADEARARTLHSFGEFAEMVRPTIAEFVDDPSVNVRLSMSSVADDFDVTITATRGIVSAAETVPETVIDDLASGKPNAGDLLMDAIERVLALLTITTEHQVRSSPTAGEA